jgi:acetyl esterase/lipase
MQRKAMAMILVCGAVLTAGAAEGGRRQPDKVLAYKTVTLAGGQTTNLTLHVFLPPGHKPADQRPAIVFFHGGAWQVGDPSQFIPHCAYLASRGMVAMSAEYRVKTKHNTTPRECVTDGKSAVRWIRQHAAELGIDPGRVAAGGGSAGGQVAAAAGTTKGFEEAGEDLSVSSRPNALVLFNPVYDNGPGGFGHGSVKPWEAFSPMHNIDSNTPPTIVFFGTKDSFVPVATAEKYKGLMEAQGRRCDLHLYDGQPHGFFNFKENPTQREYYLKTVLETDRFLASLGYLQGEPTLPPAETQAKAK